MATSPRIDQWTRQRRCVVCGAAFTFAQHNTEEARYAAKHLQDATLDAAALPGVVSKCPSCLAGGSAGRARPMVSPTKEQQAVAAALAIGEQLDRARYDEVYYYAKRVGLGVGLLSLGGMALVVGYMLLNQEGFSPIPWFVGLAIVAIAGFGASLWAFQRTRGD